MPRMTMENLLRLVGLLILTGLSSTKLLYCTADSQCQSSINRFYKCEQTDCVREDFQYRPIEIAGDVLIFLISALANAGGVGGGSMIVAIALIFFKFTLRHAVPVSQVANLAGAIVNVVGNFLSRHHTDKSAMLINYPLATIMVPSVMAGTLIGVILAAIIPSLATAVLMEAALLFTILSLKSKLMSEMAKEKAAIEGMPYQELENVATTVNYVGEPGAAESIPQLRGHFLIRPIVPPYEGLLAKDLLKEPTILDLFCRQVPNILILFLAQAVVLFCALLRGGQRAPSILGIPYCSAQSWGILLVTLALLLVIVQTSWKFSDNPIAYHKSLYPIITRRLSEYQHQVPVNVKIVLVSFISGILAGTLGVGGGMIINPLLMQIGFDPQTATTLSKLSTFFSASATVCQYAIAGSISLRHTYHLGVLGTCGSLTGNLILAKLVAKYKRPSIVIWALLLTLGLSMVVYPVHLYHSVDKSNWKSVLEWGSVCYPT